MTLRKLISRLAAIGIVVAGIVIVGVIATSGDSSATSAAAAEPIVINENGDAVLPLESIFDDTAFVGFFDGNGPFSVVGQAAIAPDDAGRRVLSFSDDFRTNRGPQLVVVLRADNGEAVELGSLRSPSGAQAYAIPDQIDLNVFNRVQIWDQQGSVDFGSAFLSPA